LKKGIENVSLGFRPYFVYHLNLRIEHGLDDVNQDHFSQGSIPHDGGRSIAEPFHSLLRSPSSFLHNADSDRRFRRSLVDLIV
jgi:hypothetical protein